MTASGRSHACLALRAATAPETPGSRRNEGRTTCAWQPLGPGEARGSHRGVCRRHRKEREEEPSCVSVMSTAQSRIHAHRGPRVRRRGSALLPVVGEGLVPTASPPMPPEI